MQRYKDLSFTFAVGGDSEFLIIPEAFYQMHGPFHNNQFVIRDPNGNRLTLSLTVENGQVIIREGLQTVRDFYGMHDFLLLRFKHITGNLFDIIIDDINWKEIQYPVVIPSGSEIITIEDDDSEEIHYITMTRCLASAKQTLNVPTKLAKSSFLYGQDHVGLIDDQGNGTTCDIRWCKVRGRTWQCALARGWYGFVRSRGLRAGDKIGLKSNGIGFPVRVTIVRQQ